MRASYHNHTSLSDGTVPMATMIDGARQLGVEVLGISDHIVLEPDGTIPDWSMHPRQIPAYIDELLGYRAEGSLGIRIGLEIDWFPEQREAISELLQQYPLDFVIGSVHEVDGFCIDYRAEDWRRLDEEARNQVHRRYWELIRSMAESGFFDIAGHLDLTKKFGFRPTIDLSREITAALDAIAAADLVVELNTAGWHLPCQEAYPARQLLEQCRQRGITTMPAADAHAPQHLLRDFGRAAELLREVGYSRVAGFVERRRSFCALLEPAA
jgi:histidinol-phosphatase (PHP family)